MIYLNDILRTFKTGKKLNLNTDENLPEKFKNMEKNALSGDITSQVNLAFEYINGEKIKKNIPRALMIFKNAAENGSDVAQFNLALAYHRGIGLKTDLYMAKKYYRMAAEKNNYNAILNLASIYSQSEREDERYQSVFLLKKAVLSENPKAQYRLANFLFEGKYIEKNTDEALAFLISSAKKDYLPSVKKLARIYSSDIYGVKDPKKAFSYYKKAANLGDLQSISNVGICLINGFGTEKNTNLAIENLKKAAEKNSTPALYILGCCYLNSIGVKKNADLAFSYFSKAAKNGCRKSIKMIKKYFEKNNFIENECIRKNGNFYIENLNIS